MTNSFPKERDTERKHALRNSITNQKKYLEDYARRNGFTNIRHFTDDGFSGVNFNRPSFQELIKEVEAGNRQNNFYCQCEAIGKSKEAFEYGISRNMQTRDVGRFFSR